jgi:hypothetical protein
MFTVRAGDDGLVYGARQLQPNAVDVGFANVQVEDPLQHNVPQSR